MTNEWTVGGIVILFIGYIVVWMVPVLLLAGLLAYILQKVKNIRTQVAILISLGIIAVLFSMADLIFPQGVSLSYLLLSPVSLFWALAIVFPLVVLWHHSQERASPMDAVICTLAVSSIFLVLAIILLIIGLATQILFLDPLLFLEFVLPTPGFLLYIYPPELVWLLRFGIVLGLAALSYLVLRSYRTVRRKRNAGSNK
jgi:hypothetical protein